MRTVWLILGWLSALGFLIGTTRILWLQARERHRPRYTYRVRGKERPH